MSRASRTLLRLAPPLLIGLVLGAAVLEILARVAWEDAWQDPTAHPVDPDLPVLNDVFDLARPNARGLNRGVPYRSNSFGLRGPEYDPHPAPGTFRIVVTGDSTTMGAGVVEADRYTNQLERRLNADATERSFEIVNIGLSGQNTTHAADRLGRALKRYHADMIVYGFSHNDIEGPDYENHFGGFAPRDDAQKRWDLAAEYESSPSYFWRYLGAWRMARMTPPSRRNREYVYNFTENDAAWEYFLSGLDKFSMLGVRYDVCAHVLIHPYPDHFDDSHPYLPVYERVERAARERGLGVTQGFPYFEGRSARSTWVSLFDAHPNRDGHAILARALHEGVAGLPDRCWETRTRN
jgi:lysophospholipase L1-like esterase